MGPRRFLMYAGGLPADSMFVRKILAPYEQQEAEKEELRRKFAEARKAG